MRISRVDCSTVSAVSLDDWILSLHVLSAFALVAAEVAFTIMVVALWRSDSPARIAGMMRVAKVATLMVMIGISGTLVFGVWLAISLDAYQLWDGWVIAAIILWAVASAFGKQTGDGYRRTAEMAAQLVSSGSPRSPELAAAMGASRAFWFHVATVVVVLVILIDMIWKPGA
jgi:uncharacterized membrane protein